MKRILVTGNPTKGLAAEYAKIWPDATFISRESGYDLTLDDTMRTVSNLCLAYDIFINNSALYKFSQVTLLNVVYKAARAAKHPLRIICIGSTTDRATKGSDWLYQQEKKALRAHCNSLNMIGTWQGGPEVSLLSFGTLSNKQDTNPGRICLPIQEAATYVEWLVNRPPHLTINELSIDPLQRVNWNE